MMMQELPATEPIPDPVGAIDAARTAWAAGAYALAVVLVLLALARGLYYAAERYPSNAIVRHLRLGNSKVRAAIVGTISVLGALSVELAATTGMDWAVLAGAACAAVALYLRPEPKGKPVDVAAVPPPAPPVNVPR